MKTTILALATAAAVLTPLVAAGQSKDVRRRVRTTPTDLAWMTFSHFARGGKFDALEKKTLEIALKGPGFRGLAEKEGYEVVVYDPKQTRTGEILRRLARVGRFDDYKAGSNMTLLDGTAIAPDMFGVDVVCGTGRVVASGHLSDDRYPNWERSKQRLLVQLCIGWSDVGAVVGEDAVKQRGDVLNGKIVDVRTVGGLKGRRTGGHDTMANVEIDLDQAPGLYEIQVKVQLEKPAKVVTVSLPVMVGAKTSVEPAVFTPR
jgi:hypothetical protein